MNNSRPINLELGSFTWPVTAIASILHRICAVIIWVGFGFLLIVAHKATSSPQGYADVAQWFSTNFFIQFISWGFLTALGYYCAGTVKHLIQDFGFGESFEGGKIISWAAISVGIVLSIIAGVIVWS